MSYPHSELIADIVTSSRILAAQGIVDSFGHVSARRPDRADRFYLSRVRAPALVTHADVLELDLDCNPVEETQHRLFAERVIHAAIYKLRPDVMAVCHHHAPTMLPFCVTGVALVPVFHLGATMGPQVTFWDSQDEFGDTNLLVSTPAQGLSMARALGSNWTLLLRRHGVTTAGRSVRELTFRTVYGARNADVQARSMQMGQMTQLTPGEALAAEEFNLRPIALDRAWEQWSVEVGQAD